MEKINIEKTNKPFSQNVGALIYKNAALIGVMYFLSRLLGIWRDRLLASRFGAGQTLDIYYSAFRVPDLIYGLLIAGSVSAAFIPLFVQKLNKDRQEGFNFAYSFLIVFAGILSLLSVIGIFTSSFWARVVSPGFSPGNLELLSKMMRIMFLSPIIMGLAAILVGVLQSLNLFFAASLSPVVYNLGIIFGIMYLAPKYGMMGLALGVFLGALLYILVLLPSIFRATNFNLIGGLKFSFDGVSNVFKLMIPTAIGFSANQIYFWVATSIASFLSVGSVAIFNLSNNMYALPLGVVAMSFAAAAFPVFSKLSAEGHMDDFLKTVEKVLMQVSLYVLPLAAFMLVARNYLVKIILGAGIFSAENIELVGASMAFFCFAVIADSFLTILARAFYALRDMWKPTLVVVLGVVLDILFSLLFLCWIRIYPISYEKLRILLGIVLDIDFRVVFLAAGFSLSSIITGIVIFYLFIKKFKNFNAQSFLKRFSKVCLAAFLGAIFGGAAIGKFPVFSAVNFWQAILITSVSFLLGALIYLLFLFLFSRQDFILLFKSFPWPKFLRPTFLDPKTDTQEPFN
jgi:putative peptidoglycan lipid II flippase